MSLNESDVVVKRHAEPVWLIYIEMSHLFMAIVDEINYVSRLQGSFAYLD